LIQSDFLENIGFYEMQKNLWRDRQAMMLDGNQHQEIGAHGDPDLRLDGIDRIAEGARIGWGELANPNISA
jgi:hypothetical protein